MYTIHPYKFFNTWVFDDARVNLDKEAFVSGADDIIDYITVPIQDPHKGVTIDFDAFPFDGYTHVLIWSHQNAGGNVYNLEGTPIMGWLCPALFKFFKSPPARIYLKATKGSTMCRIINPMRCMFEFYKKPIVAEL